MDTKFQTSFIPKKTMNVATGNVVAARHSVSILLFISVIIFIISLGGAGLAFAWQNVLISEQNQYKSDLAKDQNQFNTSLIDTLTKANTKIDLAKNLLKNHIAASEIFAIINQLTIQSVRWKSFTFTAPSSLVGTAGGSSASNLATVSMQGETDSYYSVAYQSDVFGQSSNFGTNKAIKNPILSNLSAAQNGKVDFSFTAQVDPSELSYENEINAQGAAAATSSAATASTTSNQ
ncbi:MAG: hypothetical protein KGJ35_03530 [Patescibacteria group bacterium]|nr:hypothetical protein [Patescibacteria group bacterium]